MNRIVCCSVTDAGAELARKLPYEHTQGHLLASVEQLWGEVDGFVLIAATGIAVRAIAPHLTSKAVDPAVVCVDDTGRFSVALSGGHAGANQLAREVAGFLGAVPVITTATDASGLPALDTLPGLRVDGDLAGVTRAWLDGTPPALVFDDGLEAWPVPEVLRSLPDRSANRVVVTDRLPNEPGTSGEVRLRPRSLVLGVGASTGADPSGIWELVQSRFAAQRLDIRSVGAVATIDRKVDEPALRLLAERLGVELRGVEAAALAGVDVPNPSHAAKKAVGTASVSEAAALLAAGPGSTLVAEKSVSSTSDSTLAIARRRVPEGHLAVVGLGPGHPSKRTPEASAAIRQAGVVIGYSAYVELAEDLIEPRQQVVRSPIGSEAERCRAALKLATEGHRVALVCSGDPGVYAMASLVCELAAECGEPPLTIVPGVTAALSAAAVLGAPLGHDHAAISLSDLLTPWHVITRRLEAAAAGDFVVSLYNPRSERRSAQLGEALRILMSSRPRSAPAAVLTDIGRSGESVIRTTLGELDPATVGMMSLVVIGSSSTRWIGDRMVTPRGYRASLP